MYLENERICFNFLSLVHWRKKERVFYSWTDCTTAIKNNKMLKMLFFIVAQHTAFNAVPLQQHSLLYWGLEPLIVALVWLAPLPVAPAPDGEGCCCSGNQSACGSEWQLWSVPEFIELDTLRLELVQAVQKLSKQSNGRQFQCKNPKIITD